MSKVVVIVLQTTKENETETVSTIDWLGEIKSACCCLIN